MIRTYSQSDSHKLSEHFSLSEFRCKCGAAHDTKLDTELVEKLEKLRKKLECSKIIVNSGYRCSAHDRRVGGSGSGMHTKGQAADIVCYDRSKNIIPSGKVCCAAQDIGFGGIANIDNTYTAVHMDTRTGSKWYGDEAVPGGTSSSVCEDFYDYFPDVKCEGDTKTGMVELDGAKYKITLEKV